MLVPMERHHQQDPNKRKWLSGYHSKQYPYFQGQCMKNKEGKNSPIGLRNQLCSVQFSSLTIPLEIIIIIKCCCYYFQQSFFPVQFYSFKRQHQKNCWHPDYHFIFSACFVMYPSARTLYMGTGGRGERTKYLLPQNICKRFFLKKNKEKSPQLCQE